MLAKILVFESEPDLIYSSPSKKQLTSSCDTAVKNDFAPALSSNYWLLSIILFKTVFSYSINKNLYVDRIN